MSKWTKMNLNTIVCALALACLLGGAARAEELPKRLYPASLVERPMILPRLMFQPTFDVELTNGNVTPGGGAAVAVPNGVGEAIGFGLDVGVARRVQAGFAFVIPVHPAADFGDFIADLQVNLVPRALNFRFDLGAERIAGVGGHLADTFIFGFGLPYKAKLARYVALVGGSTQARGFGHPLMVALDNGGGIFGGAAQYSNDLFALQAYPVSVGPGGSVVAGSLYLPFGVLIQPHPVVSFAARTGYRLVFSSSSFGGGSASAVEHFVPLTFELTFCIARIVDLGFTAFLPGFIAGSGAVSILGGSGSGITVRGGYADVQRYDLWVALRF